MYLFAIFRSVGFCGSFWSHCLPLIWRSFPCLISLTVIPGVDSRAKAFYGVVRVSSWPIMHCVCSLYETRSQQRQRFSPPPVSPWLHQPRRSSARRVTAPAPSDPSTPTPSTRDFTVSLEKKHPSAPSQTGSNPSPSAVAMVMWRMSHRGANPLEVIKVKTV